MKSEKRIIALLFLSLTMTLSVSAQSHQDLRDSLAKASEALAFHQDSIDLRLKKAAWNIELRQWEYAKDDYDKVLFFQPDNLAALYYRAFVNEKLGRYNFARLDYENLLKLVPGNFEAQLGLALLNEKDHRKTEAMDLMNRIVNQYPDSAVAYAARAGMEKDRGQLELAEYDFSEAIKRSPANVDYLLGRADVYLLENKKRKAIGDLKELERLGVSRVELLELYKRAR